MVRSKLKFDDEDTQVLQWRKLSGNGLFTIDKQELISMGLEVGPAGKLWAAIQKLKSEQAVGMYLCCNDFTCTVAFLLT
jgi:hypothetical protein